MMVMITNALRFNSFPLFIPINVDDKRRLKKKVSLMINGTYHVSSVVNEDNEEKEYNALYPICV